ncbi:carbohydrate ABC transporter permease [Qingrenia yutianensis]|uniref:Carbohydrate ABC transporter permease n=1 Tax=Qingrenia yutianensis TaxID=2763676 RepID=A0A926FDT1_9FIRM|nr:carbohydrate ABC transporter permease [Qingrenia yutianensis]MBC8597362.1 carbohydrate ABC transporter permease [Qingrenia yutianensis]
MKMNIIKKSIIYAFLIMFLIVQIFPVLYTFMASFKPNAEILTSPGTIFPKEFSFENYKLAWDSEDFKVKELLWNSLYYTLILLFVSVMKSSMEGYVFARGEFPGKKIVFGCFSALLFISLGTITVYPLFNILNHIHLNRSLFGLIVVKIFGINVTGIYLVRSFVQAIPKEIDEAAKIDGCGFAGIFFRIILPLLKPVMATLGILSFSATWNEYLMPTIFTLGNPSQRTLIAGVVALKSTGQAASSWNLMLAGSAISLIPVLIAYAFGNRYFVSGLAAGAVKG